MSWVKREFNNNNNNNNGNSGNNNSDGNNSTEIRVCNLMRKLYADEKEGEEETMINDGKREEGESGWEEEEEEGNTRFFPNWIWKYIRRKAYFLLHFTLLIQMVYEAVNIFQANIISWGKQKKEISTKKFLPR